MSTNPKQLLRDLLWTVNSPSLIDSQRVPTRITADQIDVNHLVAFFSDRPSRKVGHYFERLLLYWLKHIRRVDIVAHNLQIHSGERTLGEIDFLYRDEQSQLVHLEAAVKFYLYQPDHAVLGSHFIGPNVRDTFERKMHRLFLHQLPLSVEHIPDVDSREAFVKGRIFYDHNAPLPSRLPPRMSADHLTGSILRLQQWKNLAGATDVRYHILSKPFWLSECHYETDAPILRSLTDAQTAVRNLFAEYPTPVLISQFNVGSETHTETDRIFIVPDDWPLPGEASPAKTSL
ncbi:DUF1853 family protein [Rhodopirellula sp. SWK7]|uniref:DUF1853 family protein n=1 Tax=Rhodopirellula sp. SWK7 TaxID=595460 RepID=UPI0002C03D53|nr:DUF1853 family protein [Rhodopirellula sp. SWK7]EMI45138.1 protein containing DUF1853 [Rhodopirellula sp. SWK7]